VDIKSLGPMVVVPGDEELDRELEYRRVTNERAKVGSVAFPKLGKGGVGSATDDKRGGVSGRLATFLKQFKKQRLKKERFQKHQFQKHRFQKQFQKNKKESYQNETVSDIGSVRRGDSLTQQEDQRRELVISAYRYQMEFVEKITLKGLNLSKKL